MTVQKAEQEQEIDQLKNQLNELSNYLHHLGLDQNPQNIHDKMQKLESELDTTVSSRDTFRKRFLEEREAKKDLEMEIKRV